MTTDPKVYALAEYWLTTAGWTYSRDIERLAQQIQDICVDFEVDLMNDAANEEAHRHGRF